LCSGVHLHITLRKRWKEGIMAGSIKERLLDLQAPSQRIIAAQDYDSWDEAIAGLQDYGELIGAAKTNSLADLVGVPEVTETTRRYNLIPFIDYKLHDIDETMRKRARNLTLQGAGIITLHALADLNAMEAATQGVEEALSANPALERPLLLAVTVLTSHKEDRCVELFGHGRQVMVKRLAHMAVDVGIGGLVCSPQEAEMVSNDRQTQDMILVLPAIRPAYAVKPDEQATATTPKVAIEAGGDLLVVGRPLTEAGSYGLTGREAVEIIASEVAEAQGRK